MKLFFPSLIECYLFCCLTLSQRRSSFDFDVWCNMCFSCQFQTHCQVLDESNNLSTLCMFTEQRASSISEQSHEKRYLCFTFYLLKSYLDYSVFQMLSSVFWVLAFLLTLDDSAFHIGLTHWGFHSSLVIKMTVRFIKYVIPSARSNICG